MTHEEKESSPTVVNKNKCHTTSIKKGAKRKVFGPFSKKDWHDRQAQSVFNIRNTGNTLVTGRI